MENKNGNTNMLNYVLGFGVLAAIGLGAAGVGLAAGGQSTTTTTETSTVTEEDKLVNNILLKTTTKTGIAAAIANPDYKVYFDKDGKKFDKDGKKGENLTDLFKSNQSLSANVRKNIKFTELVNQAMIDNSYSSFIGVNSGLKVDNKAITTTNFGEDKTKDVTDKYIPILKKHSPVLFFEFETAASTAFDTGKHFAIMVSQDGLFAPKVFKLSTAQLIDKDLARGADNSVFAKMVVEDTFITETTKEIFKKIVGTEKEDHQSLYLAKKDGGDVTEDDFTVAFLVDSKMNTVSIGEINTTVDTANDETVAATFASKLTYKSFVTFAKEFNL